MLDFCKNIGLNCKLQKKFFTTLSDFFENYYVHEKSDIIFSNAEALFSFLGWGSLFQKSTFWIPDWRFYSTKGKLWYYS